MIGDLPKSITVDCKAYPIRTDFRVILRILVAMDDPDNTDYDKIYLFFRLLYKDDVSPSPALWTAGWEFINHGGNRSSHKVMDWEQDEELIFSAINTSIGKEVREMEYVHWWTFLGWYTGIGDTTFTQIVRLREKKATHKKLEKWEQEFYNRNREIVELKRKYTTDEKAILEELNKRLG